MAMGEFRYWEQSAQIKALRRAGLDDQAMAFLMRCIEEIESRRDVPPPWFFEQAAIILRKSKDHRGEVAVLERYAAAAERAGEQPMGHLVKRLNAARLATRIASTQGVEGHK